MEQLKGDHPGIDVRFLFVSNETVREVNCRNDSAPGFVCRSVSLVSVLTGQSELRNVPDRALNIPNIFIS